MAHEYPRIVPFTIDRLALTFTDRRDATPAEDDAARAGFRRWTIEGWNERQPANRRDCDDAPQIRSEIARRWEAWTLENPTGTREAFEAEGHTVVDETCPDPRLSSLDFVARAESGEVVGMYSLTNIVELSTFNEATFVRCMPMPGYPPGRFRYIPQSWGVASKWLLENTIEFEDGTRLEVEELFFPEDPDSHSEPTDENGMAQMWEEILAVSVEIEASSRGVPKRVRAI